MSHSRIDLQERKSPVSVPEVASTGWASRARSFTARHPDFSALLVIAIACLLRVWAASGTFLNPDEALHYRVANKASLLLAYKASLTTAHPPLLILFLYFWRNLGVSEFTLRLPSILAGTAFCWMVFKWLTSLFDRNTAWIGLIFVAFLPPMIALSAEVRQYALLLFFMASAAYLLEVAPRENSASWMALGFGCVYLAMLTHYSALLFAAALGIYSFLRVLSRRFSATVVVAWALGQLGALGLFIFLYFSHISKLKASGAAEAIQGWMRNSFYHPGHDNFLLFVVARSFGVFQYVFGQLVIGDVALILFVAGIVILLRRKAPTEPVGPSPRQAAIFLLLPFALNCAAAIAGMYPYGGTRHSAFLAMFAVAGVSFLLASSKLNKIGGRVLALVMVLLCNAFGSPHRPYMLREDQSRTQMERAITAIHQQASSNEVIFVDPQTSLQLGHYLCEQKLTPRDTSIPGFEFYNCGGYRVITTTPEVMIFDAATFLLQWNEMVRGFDLKSGETVWIVQAGWDIHLAGELHDRFPQFRDLQQQSFGRNITLFKLTVGQPMPMPIPSNYRLNSQSAKP